MAAQACAVGSATSSRPVPIVPTLLLPVHLGNDSRPGPEIIQWCDGLLTFAEEKLSLIQVQHVLFVLQLG